MGGKTKFTITKRQIVYFTAIVILVQEKTMSCRRGFYSSHNCQGTAAWRENKTGRLA
jgi:hypothetical protein